MKMKKRWFLLTNIGRWGFPQNTDLLLGKRVQLPWSMIEASPMKKKKKKKKKKKWFPLLTNIGQLSFSTKFQDLTLLLICCWLEVFTTNRLHDHEGEKYIYPTFRTHFQGRKKNKKGVDLSSG